MLKDIHKAVYGSIIYYAQIWKVLKFSPLRDQLNSCAFVQWEYEATRGGIFYLNMRNNFQYRFLEKNEDQVEENCK